MFVSKTNALRRPKNALFPLPSHPSILTKHFQFSYPFSNPFFYTLLIIVAPTTKKKSYLCALNESKRAPYTESDSGGRTSNARFQVRDFGQPTHCPFPRRFRQYRWLTAPRGRERQWCHCGCTLRRGNPHDPGRCRNVLPTKGGLYYKGMGNQRQDRA